MTIQNDAAFITACRRAKEDFGSALAKFNDTESHRDKLQDLLLFDDAILNFKVLAFKRLFDCRPIGMSGRADRFVRMIGVHTFSHDRLRTTRILCPSDLLAGQLLRYEGREKIEVHASLGDPTQEQIFNHLFMLAYRQVFNEHRTLNAWMLRAMGSRGLRLELAALPGGSPQSGRTVTVDQRLADLIGSSGLLEVICPIVIDCTAQIWGKRAENSLPYIAQMRAAISGKDGLLAEKRARLHREIRAQGLVPTLQDTLDTLERELRLPRAFGDSLDSHDEDSLFRSPTFWMLHSAIYYNTFYGASTWYTVTTDGTLAGGRGDSHDHRPCGLTILTDGRLSEEELAALQTELNAMASDQRSSYTQWISECGESRSEQHPPKEFKGWDNTAGSLLWQHVVVERHIPAYAFATLLLVLQEVAALELEHEYPCLAFVLSQESYLGSMGYLRFRPYSPGKGLCFYDLLRNTAEASGKAAPEWLNKWMRAYEEQRWNRLPSDLPHDEVFPADGPPESQQWTLDGYLGEARGHPESAEGFHLIDIDPHFRVPQGTVMHIQECVRRLELGKIGHFHIGSPPGGRMGLEAYCSLSRSITRFVAGITTERGAVLLIVGGHVAAVYQRGGWTFSNWGAAEKRLSRTATASCGLDEKALRGLLSIIERLRYIYRKGAMFVVTDLTNTDEAWRDVVARFFVSMVDGQNGSGGRQCLLGNEDDANRIMSLAQMDGCCVISREGAVLDHALKIAVSPSQLGNDEKERERVLLTLRKSLRGPGTRRWSAAMLSAAMPNWVIISISADGPTRLFHKQDVNTDLFSVE